MEKRVFGYDLVRAVAILLVLVGHVLGYIYAGTYSFFLSFLSGFFGVELFFVLSGVLIGKLLIQVFNSAQIKRELKKFLIRRWLRTLPLYFVMLFVYWFGNRYFDSVQNHDVALWKYFFFIQNFKEVQPTFFGVSWSLAVEEWFYVLFPASLYLIKLIFRHLNNKNLFIIVFWIFSIYFLGMRLLFFNQYHFSFYEGVRKVAFFRLDAISFGVLIAYGMFYFKYFLLARKKFLFLVGTIILSLNQFIIFQDHFKHLFYFNTFYYSVLGFGLACLFPFFYQLNSKNRLLISSITFISKISYSLYLIHWLVFKFLELAFFDLIDAPVKFFIFFILSLIGASITYFFIEKPILKYRERWK